MTSHAAKLRSFVTFAIDKLDVAAEGLQDDTPEEDYAELLVWCAGMARNLRSVGAAAPHELKSAIMTGLASVWDIRTDRPGPDLSVSALRDALSALLSTVLAAEDEAPEPSEEDVAPANLASMSLQDAVTYMWEVLDKAHRIEYADSGFTLNLQSKRRSGNDSCPEPLFSSVNREHPFWKSPVTVAFVALLDNYERELSEKEDYTAQEKREVALFLDALCRTSVMRFAFAFLKAHGKDPRCAKLRTMADFQNLVYDLWLAPYRRGGGPRDNSSGFEHVFVGEENNEGKITGLHNWVQYFIEEKKGNINYLGWTGKQDSDYADDVHLVNVKFSWEDDDRDTEHTEEKTCSTILCGSTVEFEFAALTTAFLAGNQQGDNKLRLGSERVRIVCYGQRQRYGGAKIGSAYLEIA